MRRILWVAAICAALITPIAKPSEPTSIRIPLVRGLSLVSALHSPKGDRENVVVLADVSPAGVNYTWHVTQRNPTGAATERQFSRFVRAADLSGAKRLNTVFFSEDKTAYPGYTAFSISTTVYDQLRASGAAPFTITSLDDLGAFGSMSGLLSGLMPNPLRLKGTLKTTALDPAPFPLLVNGRRVTVPALHLQGKFVFQDKQQEHQLWVLADRAHPLILKSVVGQDTFQMVRVEIPSDAAPSIASVERTLDAACRAELPGIYFAFGTALLDRASDRTLAEVAGILARRPAWTLSIEGHTDSIGTAAANKTLSQARAEAVRKHLIDRHGISATRVRASGYGASKPREPNTTLEGRARNRRVELVRPCRPT